MSRVSVQLGIRRRSLNNVRGLGFELALQKSFPTITSIHRTRSIRCSNGEGSRREQTLITTAKDAVKLRTLSFSLPCYVLEIEISIENADTFTRMLLKDHRFVADERRCKSAFISENLRLNELTASRLARVSRVAWSLMAPVAESSPAQRCVSAPAMPALCDYYCICCLLFAFAFASGLIPQAAPAILPHSHSDSHSHSPAE